MTPKILLIDDEPSMLKFCTAALRTRGYHVDTAMDGAQGWEELQRESYDLVITDNLMPKITGLGLIQLLRNAEIAMPVIMITGSLPPAEILKAPSTRPFTILQKPFTMDELLEAITKSLAKAKAA